MACTTRRNLAAAALTTALLAALAWAPAAGAVLPGRSGDIAFSTSYFDRGGSFSNTVKVMNPDGSNIRQIEGCSREYQTGPLVGRCASRPAWSADGRRLAYAVQVGDGSRLVTSDADGSNKRMLPALTDFDDEPTWSPGGLIAFTGKRGGLLNVFIMQADSTGMRQLTFAGGRAPAWSIRNRIAFVRNGRIYTINPDGTNKVRLRRGDEPDFSPSGRRIIYERTFRGLKRLFIMRSLHIFRRFTRGQGLQPGWSPGGGTIAFSRATNVPIDDLTGDDLLRIGLDKRGFQRLFTGESGSSTSAANHAAWQPLPR